VTGQDDSEPPRGEVPPWAAGSPAGEDVLEQGGRRLPVPPWAAGSPAGEDVLEQGGRRLPVPPWRPSLAAVILAAAAVLAGLVVGYAAGARHARSSPAARSPARPAALVAGSVTQSLRQCSAQVGRALQLGVQVTNDSAEAVRLLWVQAVLPMGGLAAIAQAWGPCGELPAATGSPDNLLPAGASTWFTVTFQVLVRCPGPLPVQFALDYDQSGRVTSIRLPGFADLGHVPYAGCPAAGP
jgi:hypothetical protein